MADLHAYVWHAALRHSRDHPTHILDPYERNCDFDTADAEAPS